MKKLLILFLLGINLSLMAQTYTSEWAEIEGLMAKQLPKSAYDKTRKLFDRSVSEKNEVQLIKASVYMMNLEPQLKEVDYDSRLQKEIIYLETSISKLEGASVSILQSILADKYIQYAQQNQHRLSQNTTVVDNQSENIALWSLDNIHSKAKQLYLQSCENKDLKSISLSKYSDIIQNADSKYINNLYDFLNYRAIEALSNERHYITEPISAFSIKKEQLIDLEQFVLIPIEAKDTSSNKFWTLKLYQKLIKEHLIDVNKDVLIDLELNRLEFIFGNYHGDNKNKIYESLLTNLFEKFKSNSEAFYALLKLADLKHGDAYHFDQNHDSTKQWLIKDAYQIYQRIIKESTDKNIVNEAQNKVNSIRENIQFQIQTEKAIPSNKPILVHVQYRNMDQIYYQILEKKTCLENENYNHLGQEEYMRIILKNKSIQKGNFQLKNLGDFQQHSTELALPSLEKGNYFIVFSKKSDFSLTNNLLSANAISISNLAYFSQRFESKGRLDIYIVDRNLGHPITDAQVDVYREEWRNGKQERIQVKSAKSDVNGKLAIQVDEKSRDHSLNFNFIITKGDDKLCETQHDHIYYDGYNQQENTQNQYPIFLDREIYRPGQTIYFKGIAYQSSNKNAPKIIPNHPVEVSFKDVNWQDIKNLTLVTNEYGSFSGTFQAPNGSLLGQMNITVNGQHGKHLRVEEYKRPTFEVMFDTLNSSPKIDDLVSVKGKAMSYSGAPLTGARVKYRVVRSINYPYWRCWWMPIPANEAEITNGEVKTNESGVYEIKFKATADESADHGQHPIFNYEVKIDVIDITGETHAAEKTIRVGKIDFEIQANPKAEYAKTDSLKLPIIVTNLNGDKISKSVKVEITKLVDPKILFQSRYWEKPDLPSMTETEFKSKFPMMPYQLEDNKENYKIEKSVYSDASVSKPLAINLSQWKPGAYKMTISAKSNTGKEIQIDRYFEVLGGENLNKPVLVQGLKSVYEPKDIIDFSLISSQKNQYIFYQLEKNKDLVSGNWIKKTTSNINTIISEEDRGGIVLKWLTVWNNRFYSGSELINIPWSNKELDIEFMSFRDKLLPGQNEEWQLKIKGNKGQKVLAEVLANMYDQSLDVFAANQYSLNPFQSFSSKISLYSHGFQAQGSLMNHFQLTHSKLIEFEHKQYPQFNLPINSNHFYNSYRGRGGKHAQRMMSKNAMPEMGMAASAMVEDAGASMEVAGGRADKALTVQKTSTNLPSKVGETKNEERTPNNEQRKTKNDKPIQVRSNLNETVFFLPHLSTDKDGNVIIKFKMNEALTKWKFMTLATTKDFAIGYQEKTVVTQKELMITPNPPRFMRANDELEFTAKVVNLSDKAQSGKAFIELYDAVTNQNVETEFGLNSVSQSFQIPAGQSSAVSWKMKVPENISALTYRVIAKSTANSDGEENSLPVLTDRMLVTETMPFNLRANQTKTFTFKEMQEKISSPTLKNLNYTLEYTSNPIWYAIQSLPYLMEYPHECSEQLFSRYFANALSSSIIDQFPKIKTVFESWKGTEAMQSNLSKNQSLKSALLEETPWVFQACKEEEQRRNIALLFDINKMAKEGEEVVKKLGDRQMPSGAFPWFPGGPESEYITQYIVEGFGHLQVLGVKEPILSPQASSIIQKAIPFLDQNIVKHYREMERNIKRYGGSLNDNHLDAFAIHYLYTRSYFGQEISKETQKIIQYYQGQSIQYWNSQSMYNQGMLALFHHRKGDKKMTTDMMKSFRERALVNEEKGMYWDNPSGYWWYQLPVETHSLMIEVFDNLSDVQKEKDDLRIFLLKNKQTNSWKTTKATASAIYALLENQPASKLEMSQAPKISLGGTPIEIKLSEAEQGTGYFKKIYKNEEVKPALAVIEAQNPNQNIAWGAVYWQYNEKLNSIKKNASSPLKIEKKLFKVLNTEKGEQLAELNLEDGFKIGDKVRVKLMLYVEREMEFLHLKDMRAAGLEPRDQVSGYRWSGGLGYYQTARDASMNFFMDYINKGTYIIEYDLNTNLKGTFSNGITTFQSMYAPEFNSHSEGMEVRIK